MLAVIKKYTYFLCPRIERSGAYSFWPVRLSICLFVCKNFNIGHIFWMVSDKAFLFHMCVPYDKTFLLVPKFLTLWPWSLTHFSKTLTLAILFEWQVIGISYVCSLWQDLSIGTIIFDLVTLTLNFDPLFKNFNIGHIVGMASDRDFICVCTLWQDLSVGTIIFYLVTLTLKFDPLFKNFNIGHIIWLASDRVFIFHMCVLYDKTFLMVPKFLTMWPWPWSLTHFSKTLTLAILFEWQVIGLSYFICVFLMTRPFYWYQICGPFDLEVWPTFQKLLHWPYILNGKW
jgi:hypothetical protein